ncbi:hypothetical protein GCM10007880_63420 [Mesorhizobium amorphae]|uniref:glycosyltransferase family 2 protein n=1 Tax=Mesorhizobium amorphae TaxID=71433 RepID=UPI00235B833D|nr:glycosyltransferase [Mesorhizobium amorphae]GLR45824.1 hypothetical protein GCM10007880_63420 [Mesorhizobium amorphae]
MHTVVAIPCLNEAATLPDVCASLGYGLISSAPSDTTLILIDNGSTDETVLIMEEVRRAHPTSVVLGLEAERGYVPPRHRGVMLALELATTNGIPAESMLVLQADADTIYDPHYLDAMRASAVSARGSIIEGVAHEYFAFSETHRGYENCCAAADAAIASLLVPEAEEVVLDDKVIGYRLDDYLTWGGLQREFDQNGDEIHAETSRLFIRAKALGATRVRADKAIAFPSRRKLEADPLLYYATAGFPRESRWRRRWASTHPQKLSLADFDKPEIRATIQDATLTRQIHTLVLFALLPMCIEMGLRTSPGPKPCSPIAPLLSSIHLDLDSFRIAPGTAFEALFRLADERREAFSDCIANTTAHGLVPQPHVSRDG